MRFDTVVFSHLKVESYGKYMSYKWVYDSGRKNRNKETKAFFSNQTNLLQHILICLFNFLHNGGLSSELVCQLHWFKPDANSTTSLNYRTHIIRKWYQKKISRISIFILESRLQFKNHVILRGYPGTLPIHANQHI